MQKIALLLALLPLVASASEPLTIAVASNFLGSAETIAELFMDETGIDVRIVSGSTGKLYAQIVHGAPYDIFLAADTDRPKLLDSAGLLLEDSLTLYASGSVVLVSFDVKLRGRDCRDVLQSGEYRHLAIANPRTAPYGDAAKSVLIELDLWESAQSRLVMGENITQTLQFVVTGNAALGFVASAQLVSLNSVEETTCVWPTGGSGIGRVDQAGAIIRRTGNAAAARKFMEFLHRDDIRDLISRAGYLAEPTLQ